MGRKEEMVERVRGLMTDIEHVRNMGIIAHIDHGKTTLSDSLIAGAGMISEELAGKQLVLDFHEDEQQRGITINAANISMVYNINNQDYLFNLIDTPGHVDFSGEVTRAMRAVDGAVVVVDAVEGPMPQTETVLRQALKERVRPVLYINKVDRLINELQIGPQEMQERFLKIISKINNTIKRLAPPDLADEWLVSPEKGSVAFGSAFNKWAISIPWMKKTGITFKDIIDACKEGRQKELSKRVPVYSIIMEMAAVHLPNPKKAQTYRIPTIWKGPLDSGIGKAMRDCDPSGPTVLMVTNVTIDPHAGDVATCRVWSGVVTKGQKLQLVNAVRENTVQQCGLYMGAERLTVDRVTAGNMVAITGLRDAYAGETAAIERIEPFEAMKHFSEPVITKSIEAKNTADLPKLVEVLRQVSKEDPMIKIEINEETGEHLISGMGELHLEVIEDRIKKEKKLEVVTSKPIIVYRETCMKLSEEMEGKSPNRHNRFYFTAEPLPDSIYNAIVEGEITEKSLKDSKAFTQKLVDLGMERDMAKKPWAIYNKSMLFDMTKGITNLQETQELIVQGFEEALDRGPLAQEKVQKVLIKLHDAKLHEDAVHRGPSQTLPAVRNPIYACLLSGSAILLEPMQKIFISVPQELMGSVTKEVQGRRGQILDIQAEGDNVTIESKAPLAELFGFASDIRSATQGKAIWSTEYAGYEKVPSELTPRIIKQIRERKGLKPEPPTIRDFIE
jgi:elongation factor 2